MAEELMKIIVTNRLTLVNDPENLQKAICDRLTILNPKWLENERQSRWNGNTPRVLQFYEKTASGLVLPRGFCRQLIDMARQQSIAAYIDDRRRVLPNVDFNLKRFVIHIDQTLHDDRIHGLEREIVGEPGVYSACLNDKTRHLIIVDFDAMEVRPTGIVRASRGHGPHAHGPHAQMVGM